MRKETVSTYAVVPYLNDEERQEDRRVRIVRRYCLRERWFLPANSVRSSKNPKYKFRKPKRCGYLRDRSGRLPRVVPAESLRPVYADEQSPLTLQERVMMFIGMAPRNNVYVLYRKALDDEKFSIAILLPTVLKRMRPRIDDKTLQVIRNTFTMLVQANKPFAKDILAAVQ